MCFAGTVPVTAAPFTNLNFESAFGGSDPGPSVLVGPTSVVFPGWTLRYDDQIASYAAFNTYVLDAPSISVISASASRSVQPYMLPIHGTFGAQLKSSYSMSLGV